MQVELFAKPTKEYTLRPYQQAAVDAILASESRRQLVAMATGLGKTVIFSNIIKALIGDGRCLVLAHRTELLEQAVEKISSIIPHVSCAIEQAGKKAREARIIVGSVQSLTPRRLVPILNIRGAKKANNFKLIVIDEAHHAVAPTYTKILEMFGALGPSPSWQGLVLGVTATPKRGDNVGLSKVFDTISYEYGIREGISDGWLAELTGWRIETQTDLDDVQVRAGDFVRSQLAECVNTVDRNRGIVKAYLEHAHDRKALAFCVDVAHAHALAFAFQSAGVAADAVDGTTPKDRRRAILGALAAGETQVVCNCGVLTEGFDEPTLGAILMARPTKSSLLYTQCIGRGTRRATGKEDCLVLDFADNSSRHSLCSVASLFGLHLALDLKGKSAKKVSDELQQIQLDFPWLDTSKVASLEDIAQVHKKIDFFATGDIPEIRDDTKMAWQPFGDGYMLNLPEKTKVYVHPNRLGQWVVASRIGRGVRATEGVFDNKIEALRHAETCVPEQLKYVAQRKSPWRKKPATDKQLKIIRKLGISVPDGVTAGQASVIIGSAGRRRK